jgi:hypothetical protein
MEDEPFRAGEQLWLRGQQVTFLEYHRYARHRIGAAMVRRGDDETVRVVPLARLSRDRAESIALATTIPVS